MQFDIYLNELFPWQGMAFPSRANSSVAGAASPESLLVEWASGSTSRQTRLEAVLAAANEIKRMAVEQAVAAEKPTEELSEEQEADAEMRGQEKIQDKMVKLAISELSQYAIAHSGDAGPTAKIWTTIQWDGPNHLGRGELSQCAIARSGARYTMREMQRDANIAGGACTVIKQYAHDGCSPTTYTPTHLVAPRRHAHCLALQSGT